MSKQNKKMKPGHSAIRETVTEEYITKRGIHVAQCCKSCTHCKSVCTPNSGNLPAPHVCETLRVYVDGGWTCDHWDACENVKLAGTSEGKVSQYASRFELLKKLVETQQKQIEMLKVWIDEHQSPGYKSLCDGKRAQIRELLQNIEEIKAEMADIPMNERKLTPTTSEVEYYSVQDFVKDIEVALTKAARRFTHDVKFRLNDGTLVEEPRHKKDDDKPIELDPLRRFDLDQPATITLCKHTIAYWKYDNQEGVS